MTSSTDPGKEKQTEKEKEKETADIDIAGNDSLDATSAQHLDLDPIAVKRIWRKVDLRIMPIACLLYLASYIDRANIGNAKVLGMASDLHLSSNAYNWALSIFFVGYVVYETPSNILLKWLSPRWYIPILTIIWGIICALVAIVHTSSGLLAVRFFLGVAEAGFLPGIIYWIGCWYPRPMQGKRFAILYSSASLTGAFGGLLATGLHALDGTRGIAGWRWIFIIEGAITSSLGILALRFMSAYPSTVPWLTPEEKTIINTINLQDRALNPEEPLNRQHIKSAFTDPRTYLWGLIYFCTYIPVYSIILSLPSIISRLGYSGTTATLMACPPYGFGFIIVLLAGYTSDRWSDRYWHYVTSIALVMVSLIVLMTTRNDAVKYAMFFLVMFMFVPISLIWSWLAMNTAGSNKRAAATGLVCSMGNIGGAFAGQIYRSEWAPRYVQGHGINLACYGVAIFAGTALWMEYRRDNWRRDKEGGGVVISNGDLGVLGDRHPGFRYYV
ncbi:hypothetical protein RUND412_002436 [Rhizina undulata]